MGASPGATGAARSWAVFVLQALLMTAAGPTAYVLCPLIVVALAFVLPTRLFLSLAVLYAADCFFGRAHVTGVREAEWARRWGGWRAIVDWFGMECHLDDECELLPGQTYLFLTHPHGVCSWENVFFYCPTLCPNPLLDRFPFLRVTCAAASVVLQMPLLRDAALRLGYRDVGWIALSHALKEGRSVVINLDGEAGALVARPGYETAVLGHRTGFVRLALDTGAAIVPCYAFGLVDVYQTGPGWLRPLQRFFHRRLRWAMPVFFSRYGWLPDRKRVVLVVGKPIPVPPAPPPGQRLNDALVTEVHAQYFTALTALFEKHKERLGYADRQLHILDSRNPY